MLKWRGGHFHFFFHVVDNRFAVLHKLPKGHYAFGGKITVKIEQIVLGRGSICGLIAGGAGVRNFLSCLLILFSLMMEINFKREVLTKKSLLKFSYY